MPDSNDPADPTSSQPFSSSPPPRSPSGLSSGQAVASGPLRPMPAHVVHVAAKPGGFWRAVMFVIGLMVFGFVFIIGIGVGVAIMTTTANYEDVVVRSTYREGSSNTLAIIPVVGVIDDEQARFVHAAVKHVLEDSAVKGVILRVDSPGGSVSASDQIWYEVQRLQNSGRPVVASYGGVAASGGYYVSCGANAIVAEETCITGSIGVIAQVLTLENLMNKVGVQPVTLVASGSPEKAVANDIFRSWNEMDKAKVRTMLDAAYTTFNTRVRNGRKNAISDPAKIDALANGSIYTAQQAKDSGLVDAIGYLDDAIAQAETLAGLPAGRSEVVTVRQPPTLFGDGMFVRSNASTRKEGLNNLLDADSVRGLVNDLASPRVLYLMH